MSDNSSRGLFSRRRRIPNLDLNSGQTSESEKVDEEDGATVPPLSLRMDEDVTKRRSRKRETFNPDLSKEKGDQLSQLKSSKDINNSTIDKEHQKLNQSTHVTNSNHKGTSGSLITSNSDRSKLSESNGTSSSNHFVNGDENGRKIRDDNDYENIAKNGTEIERVSTSLNTRNDTSAEEQKRITFVDGSKESYEHISSESCDSNLAKSTSFLNRLWLAMRKRYKPICAFLTLLAVVFTAVKTGHLTIQKAQPPTKMFDPSSPITEFEHGNLNLLKSRAFKHDLVFVMYYASWDADCIRFKEEYEIIARHFQKQVFFAAINCWWLEGECSKALSIRRYPAFVASVRNAADVEYHGPLLASYIIPFIDNLLNPVIPLHNDAEFLHMKSKHDGVVVAYFDFNKASDSSGYKKYFTASVKALSYDPWRRIQFTVITNSIVAQKLNLIGQSSISLSLWNATFQFPQSSWTVNALVDWVYEIGDKKGALLVDWITPSGIKSLSLSSVLKEGPTFILFTPRSLVLDYSPYFELLREIAMDYYNCNASPLVRSLIHRSILRRHMMDEALMELEEKCHELSSPPSFTAASVSLNAAAVLEGDTCCTSQNVKWRPSGRPAEKTCYCTACVHVVPAKCPARCKNFNCLSTASNYLDTFDPSRANNSAVYCSDIKAEFQPEYKPYYQILTTCLGQKPSVDSSSYAFSLDSNPKHPYGVPSSRKPSYDDKVRKSIENFQDQYCRRLQLGMKRGDFNLPETSEFGLSSSRNWRSNFTGLGCSSNKTLSFISIDSVVFPSFAESIGIDVFNETHSTTAAIVEASQETIYLLNHELASTSVSSPTINKPAIYEFIKNFTYGTLRRYLKGSGTTYSSSSECLRISRDSSVVCVPEITAKDFEETVLDPHKNVLLMYYAPWCGFCTSVAHIFLSAAKYFEDIKEVMFARINGDKNDLPFHYTAEKYPTLILYPAWRKADSKVFPSSEQITTASLVQFVIENSHPIVRWKISMNFCNSRCLFDTIKSYSKKLQNLYRQIRNLHQTIGVVRSELNEKTNLSKKQKDRYATILKQWTNAIRRTRNKIHLISRFKQLLNQKLQKQIQINNGSDEKILNTYGNLDPMKKESVKVVKDLVKDEL